MSTDGYSPVLLNALGAYEIGETLSHYVSSRDPQL